MPCHPDRVRRAYLPAITPQLSTSAHLIDQTFSVVVTVDRLPLAGQTRRERRELLRRIGRHLAAQLTDLDFDRLVPR